MITQELFPTESRTSLSQFRHVILSDVSGEKETYVSLEQYQKCLNALLRAENLLIEIRDNGFSVETHKLLKVTSSEVHPIVSVVSASYLSILSSNCICFLKNKFKIVVKKI